MARVEGGGGLTHVGGIRARDTYFTPRSLAELGRVHHEKGQLEDQILSLQVSVKQLTEETKVRAKI